MNNLSQSTTFVQVRRSLSDLLGLEYLERVGEAHAFLHDSPSRGAMEAAVEPVEFYPATLQAELTQRLDRVGRRVLSQSLSSTPAGAGTAKFNEATKTAGAPLSARGYYRVGEDGRLYLTTKSEHYHAPLGHGFPGYALIDRARALGIPNATHNNTRGFITRRMEEELIREANGLGPGDRAGLEAVLRQTGDLGVLNRVLNLETGSLAVEAALKMILARFYRMQDGTPEPKYRGRRPVILVMGNDDGGLLANYHGTTILTQMLRGMWPDFERRLEQAGLWQIVPIRPNRCEDIDRAFAEFECGETKIAGFFHEIIMMNYAGRRLTPEFLQYAHQLCARHDVPTMVDEIQTCLWAPGLFLFRQYGLRPSLVSVGKGFPGGEYPASRLIFSSALDVMPQFGALVTNGQEELASLAYLITMEWARANADVTSRLGCHFEDRLRDLARAYPEVLTGIDGWGHLTSLCFRHLNQARAFTAALNERGLDLSVQTYKADCPPVVLSKLPLIMDRAAIDFVATRMEEAVRALSANPQSATSSAPSLAH